MDYFSILDLNREPFSNSPDPEFFYQSRQHLECLQRLELALRLRRGLNVVIGAVGTGKTTLCRQLIRRFSEDPDLETHLVLDPDFSSTSDLLQAVADMFDGSATTQKADPWQLKERIKHALFRKGVDEKKTVVLIIDEGQKIPGECLELLREFLNYETNEHKLLQIAIFAQPEFEGVLAKRPNFADRINLKHVLGPMNFSDTREMIRYRLSLSSEAGHRKNLFTILGLWAIYRATGGYPRKIVHLCHQCLLAVIIQNRSRAGWALVRSCSRRSESAGSLKRFWPALAAGAVLALAAVFLSGQVPGFRLPEQWRPSRIFSVQTAQVGVSEARVEKPEEPRPAPQPPAQEASAAPEAALQRQRAGAAASDAEKAVVQENSAPEKTAASTSEPSVAAQAEPESPGGDSLQASVSSAPAESRRAAPSQPAPAPAAVREPPEFLGTVVLQDRETLWRLVEKVYGVFEDNYLKSIRNTNPAVQNPNRVEAGAGIRVPAIAAKVDPPAAPMWWIRLDRKTALNEAIDVLRNHPDDMPPIRLLPHWHPSEGLSISVLLAERYRDPAAARLELERLKAASGVEAELVSGWKPGTVFYADPYRRG